MVGKPERWRLSTAHCFAPFLLYSVRFGKAAEVFTLREEAFGFVWWPRGFERAECGVKPGPGISEVLESEA